MAILTSLKNKILDFLQEKAEQYLPGDEPMTERERIYEEGKRRVYEMHQREKDLFYAEQAWMEGSYGKIYGETAKGSFRANEKVVFLDVQGNPLFEGEIFGIEDEEKKNPEENKRVYLIFDGEKLSEKEDFFVQAYYVIKKH